MLQRQVKVPRLSRADRAVLAALARLLPGSQLRLIVPPRTLLRWHAGLVRRHWSYPHQNPGRPRTDRRVRSLVLEMARDNPGWGYRRIHGELAGLGRKIAPPAVWQIVKDLWLWRKRPIFTGTPPVRSGRWTRKCSRSVTPSGSRRSGSLGCGEAGRCYGNLRTCPLLLRPPPRSMLVDTIPLSSLVLVPAVAPISLAHLANRFGMIDVVGQGRIRRGTGTGNWPGRCSSCRHAPVAQTAEQDATQSVGTETAVGLVRGAAAAAGQDCLGLLELLFAGDRRMCHRRAPRENRIRTAEDPPGPAARAGLLTPCPAVPPVTVYLNRPVAPPYR